MAANISAEGNKLWELAAAIVADNSGATKACCTLISMATRMATELNAEQKQAVAWHMRAEVNMLESGPRFEFPKAV